MRGIAALLGLLALAVMASAAAPPVGKKAGAKPGADPFPLNSILGPPAARFT